LVAEDVQLKNRSCLFLVAAWLLLLAGCASVSPQSPSTPAASESIPLGETPQTTIPPQLGEGIAAEPVVPKPVMSVNPAVIALLDRARLDNEAGRRDAAGASLERAQRIEPRNAWLWHELAQLRLAKGQYVQAITLAQKSTSFAGRDRHLKALNWQVIGNARVAQGDATGAEQAFKLATELEQAAKAEAERGF
jgi:predicted Zn-dependent protease